MKKTKQMIPGKIDETDNKIMGALLENAKLSYRQIAKRLLISAATVMHRVRRLEQAGIIRKYTVQLDYQKLGYEFVAAIDIRVMKGRLFEVEKLVAKHPNVHAVYDVTGSFDSLVLVKFRNRRELDSFVKKIQTYDFVERTETRLVLNTIKEDFVEI
jgi:DNA-binding Lrp family transcriptional regulator